MVGLRVLQKEAKDLNFNLWGKGKYFYLSRYTKGFIKQGRFNSLGLVKTQLEKFKKRGG